VNVEEHQLIFGRTGSGKTWLMSKMFKASKAYSILLDVKDDIPPIAYDRNTYQEDIDFPVNELVDFFYEQRPKIVIKAPILKSIADTQMFLGDLLDEILMRQYELKVQNKGHTRPFPTINVYVDEADLFLPKSGQSNLTSYERMAVQHSFLDLKGTS